MMDNLRLTIVLFKVNLKGGVARNKNLEGGGLTERNRISSSFIKTLGGKV
jgi:hypothetical protein